MSFKLDIKAFFFNAKTDYLPYYKTFKITLDEDATAKALLMAIAEQNENFSFPKQKLVFRINGWVVEARQPMSEVVERLGTELKIDPVSEYRSNDGLKINDSDFMQSFELLAPYATETDLKYYKTLYPLHYASETSQFVRDHIGDAILVLADKMISEGSEYKKEILEAISQPESGLFTCEYENNLFKAEDHTEKIEALKRMALSDPDDAPSLMEMIKAKFAPASANDQSAPKEEKVIDTITIDNIEEKFVAYYPGDKESDSTVLERISSDTAGLVRFEREKKRCGLLVLPYDASLAYRKAGAILLDAFDNAAEVLVIEDAKSYEMISKHFSKIEKEVGRKIHLELTTSAALKKQLSSVAA